MPGQRIGYIRVSSFDQNPERQLEQVPLDRVFTDKASGKDMQRPELDRLLTFVREGDMVIVHSMDRLARNLDDLRRLVQSLTKRGVAVQFLKENMTFTGEDTPMANLMLSVMGAFAEFERALIKERQREGIALAKQRGVYTGRKRALSPAQVAELRRRAARPGIGRCSARTRAAVHSRQPLGLARPGARRRFEPGTDAARCVSPRRLPRAACYNGRMKPHPIIAAWKGDPRSTAIAARAAALKKAGMDAAAIRAAITTEFGPPTTRKALRAQPGPFAVFGTIGPAGEADIEPDALAQLELAMRLPIADRGALMPDAHQGYALPIGGVFRAHNSVCPAMVGVDIACRMMLTIFDLSPDELLQRRDELFATLKRVTIFGAGADRPYAADHAVLDDPRWNATNQLRGLRQKGAAQLGTSGSGNYFAELVIGELLHDAIPGAPQHFAGLLTHSGSRGVGYAVANHYMRVAAQETKRVSDVPRYYEWLGLDTEAGKAGMIKDASTPDTPPPPRAAAARS
jgi:DNA invertase Pin-like site-specific DNA recombinase